MRPPLYPTFDAILYEFGDCRAVYWDSVSLEPLWVVHWRDFGVRRVPGDGRGELYQQRVPPGDRSR